jgi:hypothetical protein
MMMAGTIENLKEGGENRPLSFWFTAADVPAVAAGVGVTPTTLALGLSFGSSRKSLQRSRGRSFCSRRMLCL